MDRRQQEIQDWGVEQSRLKGQAERLRALEEAQKAAETEAARKAAEAAAAQKAEGDKGALDRTDPAQNGEGGQSKRIPFAPAPAPKSDQVGANGPTPTAPTPPPRPKAHPTQVDPGLY
jgi:hypothetical protein